MADLKHIDRMLAEEEISLFTQLPFLGPNEKKAYRTFACHAAFPLVLTTDLLFNLWMNFAEDENGEQLHIPREAVSDFLLSGICSKVGHKTYEVKPQMRELLLNELLQDLVFGPQRIRKLADFTLLYVRERLDEENLLERTIGEVLRWGALAYVRPEEAAERMAQALAKSLHHKDRSGQLRMHHLMEKLSGPMQRFDAFRDLRKFASGVARNVAGKGEAAETAFAEMDKQQINIGKVTLEAPETKKVQPPICFFGYITSPPQESKSMTVLDFDDEHRRIIPYFRRLEEKGLIRIVVQYDLRPVEIENILTDPSYAGEICFLHLSGHASTHGNPVGEQMPQQQSSQSASFGSYSAGFNPDNSLISWRSLSAIFEAHSQLQLISLDDVLTSDQLGDFRNDLETRMNKVFNPQLPQLVRNRNLLVIDHNEVEIDFMPFLEAFYDKLTLNETLNNSFNEASEETLGQLLRLKRKPVMSWLSNGWWQLSEHPYLQPDMFKLDAIPRF
ncbi:MAG: hypothetical protein GYB31_00795 [Bacteroidetes bacterium]|nr:hypothetical protein [Bacteroidota bacterium]